MRRPRTRVGTLLHLCWTLVAWSCRAPSDRPAPQECAPPTSELPSTSSADGIAGEYQLRLVATSGAKSGSAVDGALTLQPQSGQLRYRVRPGGATDSAVGHPFYGAADVDLNAVDAVMVGDITSLDPAQPGVLVVQSHARAGQTPRAEIMLRLGSDANRQDRQRIDGGYTALRVRQLSPGGFSGTWASGVVSEQSAGYFCAVRADGRTENKRDP